MMDNLDDDVLTESTSNLVEREVISINRKIKSNLSGYNICFKLDDNFHNHSLIKDATHNAIDSNNNSNNGKVCVQYVISCHGDGTSYIPRKSDIQSIAAKLDGCDADKRSFISLSVGNLHELDEPSSSPGSKNLSSISSSCSTQRSLISPTDFLTLSEEASSAVKKDVNLSASRLESLIKKSGDSGLNASYDRYCESPFLMETPREVPLISDDDASNNGRASCLSESHEEIPGDDLFANTLADQHEVVITQAESDNSRATPVIRDSVKLFNHDHHTIKEVKFEEEVIEEHGIEENGVNGVHEDQDIKPDFAMLNPLPHNSIPITSTSPLSSAPNSPTFSRLVDDFAHQDNKIKVCEPLIVPNITTTSSISTLNLPTKSCNTHNNIITTINNGSSSSQQNKASPTVTLPVAPMDIKLIPTGILQLAANLASVFPSSTIHKQIALQLLREDGTSIIVPIATRDQDSALSVNEPNDRMNNGNNIAAQNATTTLLINKSSTTSPASGTNEATATNDTDRPFKCELCNSTFTRLGNYTRHKKIHSLPSKEDQRFRCEVCNKSFIQRCDLARHQHIHRGTEPHRCSQCGKGYIRHSDLVTHQRFHNKEKPFACPHCSKGFCQRGDLNRHLRSIHLQLKPILCSHCHKKFAKEETLLRHINANHRDVVN